MFVPGPRSVLALLALLSALPAPAIGVSPDPLSAGGTATVSFSGGTPSSSVTVSISNGASPPFTQTASVEITLDANGDGQAPWPVPSSGWSLAIFSAPGASPVGLQVIGAGGPG